MPKYWMCNVGEISFLIATLIFLSFNSYKYKII